MSISGNDLLEEAIEALQRGQSVEFESSHPDRASDLQENLAIARVLSGLAASIPVPSSVATESAWLRLREGVAASSSLPATRPRTRSQFASRYAMASIAALVLLIAGGAAFLATSDNDARAASIEGVVVSAADGSVTVQTIDGLYQFPVSPGASIADPLGTAIALDTIQGGDVVQVSVHPGTNDQSDVASAIALIDATFEKWCVLEPGRCESLSNGFDDSVRSCEARPDACGSDGELLRTLSARAREAAMVDQLASRCRAGEPLACRELAAFCKIHPAPCPAAAVPQATGTPTRTAELVATATFDATRTPITTVTPPRPAGSATVGPGVTAEARPTATPQVRPQPTPVASPDRSIDPTGVFPTPIPTAAPSFAPRDDAGGGPGPR